MPTQPSPPSHERCDEHLQRDRCEEMENGCVEAHVTRGDEHDGEHESSAKKNINGLLGKEQTAWHWWGEDPLKRSNVTWEANAGDHRDAGDGLDVRIRQTAQPASSRQLCTGIVLKTETSERFRARFSELDSIAQNLQGTDGIDLGRGTGNGGFGRESESSMRRLRIRALCLIESFSYFVFVCVAVALHYIATLTTMVASSALSGQGVLEGQGAPFLAQVCLDFVVASLFFFEWALRIALYGPHYVWYHLFPGSLLRLADATLVLIIFSLALMSFIVSLDVDMTRHAVIGTSGATIIAICAEKLVILRLLTISNLLTYRSVSSRAKRSLKELERELDSERMHLTINEDEIEIGERIGSGAYGEVHLGLWRGTLVAVKRGRARTHDERTLRAYHLEAETLRHMRHPNVVLFLGFFREESTGCISLVTEYCQGGDLRGLLHNSSVTIDTPFRLKAAIGAACGLAYLHGRGIVHRDFKTSNLLVESADGSSSTTIKVCDFGMAGKILTESHLYASHQKNTNGNDSELSISRGVGTIQYCAPEVLRGEPCTTASDVYGYGIVLWEIAARKTPYKGISRFKMMLGVVDGTLRPDITILEGVEREYVELMQRCWAHDPSQRPDMARTLHALLMMIKRLGLATAYDLKRISRANVLDRTMGNGTALQTSQSESGDGSRDRNTDLPDL